MSKIKIKKLPKAAMPFPDMYKSDLLTKSKNITIRVGDEAGKYKVGKLYEAESYSGTKWNMKIKVIKVVQTEISNLSDFKIPRQEVENIKKIAKENYLSYDIKVDLIHFKIV